MSRYIHDKELNEYYVPEQLQCDNCMNEATHDGLCHQCWIDSNIMESVDE
jgi:hypothetical protein